jgi:hypothetical protein
MRSVTLFLGIVGSVSERGKKAMGRDFYCVAMPVGTHEKSRRGGMDGIG